MTVTGKNDMIRRYLKEYGAEAINLIVSRVKTENNLFFRKSKLYEFLLKNDNYKNFSSEELELLGFSLSENTTENIIKNDITEEKPTEKIQENTALEIVENTKIIQENTDLVDMEIKKVLVKKENKEKFLELLNNLDLFLDIKNRYDDMIIIPTELLNLETCVTSIRLSKDVLKRFNAFCDKNKSYTKTDYINYALTSMMDRLEK